MELHHEHRAVPENHRSVLDGVHEEDGLSCGEVEEGEEGEQCNGRPPGAGGTKGSERDGACVNMHMMSLPIPALWQYLWT